MTLIKVQHDKNNPYTIINKSIVDDARISYKAVGLWLYAFSKKEDWQFYLADLSKRHTDKIESVRSGLKELEDAGYLYRYKKKNEKGQFKGWEWIFFETPKSESEIKEMFPTEGFSLSREAPNSVEPPPIVNIDPLANKEAKLASSSANANEESSDSLVKRIGLFDGIAISPDQKKSLANHSYVDIKAALDHMRRSSEAIPNPFGWLRDCLAKRYWEEKTVKTKPNDKSSLDPKYFNALKTLLIALVCDKKVFETLTPTATELYLYTGFNDVVYKMKGLQTMDELLEVLKKLNQFFINKGYNLKAIPVTIGSEKTLTIDLMES